MDMTIQGVPKQNKEYEYSWLRSLQPCVLWLTGLSGSGKSTIANALHKIMVQNGLPVENLDGDKIRDLFPGTGFSKHERDAHVRRVGFMATLLEKHNVCVLASFISPYRNTREYVRKLCQNYVEIHVSATLETCEKRDVKGLYKKARSGEICEFTGISDPYEIPLDPEITTDSEKQTVQESVDMILAYLYRHLRTCV